MMKAAIVSEMFTLVEGGEERKKEERRRGDPSSLPLNMIISLSLIWTNLFTTKGYLLSNNQSLEVTRDRGGKEILSSEKPAATERPTKHFVVVSA